MHNLSFFKPYFLMRQKYKILIKLRFSVRFFNFVLQSLRKVGLNLSHHIDVDPHYIVRP